MPCLETKQKTSSGERSSNWGWQGVAKKKKEEFCEETAMKATREAGQSRSQQLRRRRRKAEHLRVEPILVNSNNKRPRLGPTQQQQQHTDKRNFIMCTCIRIPLASSHKWKWAPANETRQEEFLTGSFRLLTRVSRVQSFFNGRISPALAASSLNWLSRGDAPEICRRDLGLVFGKAMRTSAPPPRNK